MRHSDSRGLTSVAEQSVEPTLVAVGGSNVTEPWRSPVDPGQLDGVQQERGEREVRARTTAQPSRRGHDGGDPSGHVPTVPGRGHGDPHVPRAPRVLRAPGTACPRHRVRQEPPETAL